MSFILISTTAAVCALSADPQCGPPIPNLVVNGAFDTFDLSGWTLECDDANCIVEADPSGVSGQFRRTVVDGFRAKLSQSVLLSPGRYAVGYTTRGANVDLSFQYNNGYFRAGPISISFLNSFEEYTEYREFSSSGGSSEVSFEYTTYYRTNEEQSFALDDIYLVQIDDAGAAKAAAASLAAMSGGAERFIDSIFSAQGSSPPHVAARPVATRVAGPAKARSAQWRAWGSAGYSEAIWDDFNTSARDATLSGGVETDAGDGWTAGFAATIAGRELDLSGPLSSVASSGSSGSLALYAVWAPVADGGYARATLGGGLSSRDHLRSFVFGGDPAAADGIDGSHWFASAEGGYRFELSSSASLTPYVRATHVETREDSYVERDTGGGPAFTTIDATTQDSLSSQLGVRGTVTELMGAAAALSFHGAWRHEFNDQNGVGFTYTEPSIDPMTASISRLDHGADSAVYGVELEIPLSDQSTAFVRYDGEAGDGASVNSGQVGFRFVW